MDGIDVTYGPGTALIIVDLQNDFADPRDSLCVPGGEDFFAVANVQILKARAAGATIVYTQDWHPSHTPRFAQDGGIWPAHCVAGSWGADFMPGPVIDGSVVHKGTGGEDSYSGFSTREVGTGSTTSTELARLLSDADVHVIVLCGLATDYCVKETASTQSGWVTK